MIVKLCKVSTDRHIKYVIVTCLRV